MYSLTYYEGIDSEGYRKKKKISVEMRKRLKYDMRNRSGMEGRKKNTLGYTAKKVNCTSIGWNTLILSLAALPQYQILLSNWQSENPEGCNVGYFYLSFYLGNVFYVTFLHLLYCAEQTRNLHIKYKITI